MYKIFVRRSFKILFMSSDQQKPQIMKIRKKLKQLLLTLKQKKITNNKNTNLSMDKPIIQKQEMIEGILSLSQKFVREIMIPRVDINAIEDTATLKELVKLIID